MKYFIKSDGWNRIALQVSNDVDVFEMVTDLQLQKVNWFKFHLFEWGFINAEAKTAKTICENCGRMFSAIEEFFDGESEGLPVSCDACRAATRLADRYHDQLYER